MKSAQSIKKIKEIRDAYLKGIEKDQLISALKELREIAKEEKDPIVVKSLRLAYEYIEENGDFNISFTDEEEEGEDEMEELTGFEYFLELISQSENKYNQEELMSFVQVIENQE